MSSGEAYVTVSADVVNQALGISLYTSGGSAEINQNVSILIEWTLIGFTGYEWTNLNSSEDVVKELLNKTVSSDLNNFVSDYLKSVLEDNPNFAAQLAAYLYYGMQYYGCVTWGQDETGN